MKTYLSPISLILAGLATLATAQTELRPIQKLMQARAGWMKAMNQNLAAKNLAEVGKDAEELSKQAAKVAGGIEGERKALSQKVSDLAKAVADAAAGGDEAVIKTRLGELKATCVDCHAKFRDK
ncbi:MAG: cytochrome c [Holophagaceae bacterium]|nr:cytochrome c [Holophagaceae bacterium]